MTKVYTKDIIRFDINKDNNRLNKMSTKRNTINGISLSTLNPTYISVLKNRIFIKPLLNDDRLLEILFHCIDIEEDQRILDKIYYLKSLDLFITEKQLEKYEGIYEWNCITCNKRILINTNIKVIHSDFLCEDCFNNSERTIKINNSIIQEFKKFNKFISNRIKKEYKYITKKIKKNRI